MPFIGLKFAKEYLIPNYVGEGLAALVPSVLSLIQGLGQNPPCTNVTDPTTNTTQLVPGAIVPVYSVQLYFFFMFGILCVSTSAFSMLAFSPYVRPYRKGEHETNRPSPTSPNHSKSSSPPINSEAKLRLEDSTTSSYDLINDTQAPLNYNVSPVNSPVPFTSGFKEKFILLSYTVLLSFFCYGVLPGLQSYSTLPYGN